MQLKNKEGFRQLHLPLNKLRRLDAVFWWMAGIAIAFLFVACVVITYVAHLGHAS